MVKGEGMLAHLIEGCMEYDSGVSDRIWTSGICKRGHLVSFSFLLCIVIYKIFCLFRSIKMNIFDMLI